MRIICDTNIWYNLGKDEELFESVKDQPLTPNYNNIFELQKSNNIINDIDLVRGAARKIFYFQENLIYEPPFYYLAKLNNPDFKNDPTEEIPDLLGFITLLVEGSIISEDKILDYKNYIIEKKNNLLDISSSYNDFAINKIKPYIKDKKFHSKIDTIGLTFNFLNSIVKTIFKNKYNLYGLPLEKIEFLVNVFDKFFKLIELSNMKIQPNDWHDFSFFAYVQPGDLYWTAENRWKNIIKEAGMEKYLFEK